LINRHVEQLASQIPQRDVDRGDGFKLIAGAMPAESHAAIHPFPVTLDSQRVPPD